MIGKTPVLRQLEPEAFTDAVFGVPTVTDILRELEKPGRDPRPVFKTATFREGVEKLDDLKPGMVLEGVVTNVAAFGAFVDLGVHQDGLVHISAMANTYVADPRKIATPGDVVRVKVLEVDAKRQASVTPRTRFSLIPSRVLNDLGQKAMAAHGGTDGSQTRRWREMDSNHRYPAKFFWLPVDPRAIHLPQYKPARSRQGPMVRVHLPPPRILTR